MVYHHVNLVLRGSKKEVVNMLNLAEKKNVRSIIEVIPSK